MEKFKLESDIKTFYVQADSFPDGIMAAHQALHVIVPFSADRWFFGISRPENGEIIYKAAAEEILDGEAENFSRPTFIIPKGEYISLIIHDFPQDAQSIGRAFEGLTAQRGIDPQGYCIEWYLSATDVRCMVRLKT